MKEDLANLSTDLRRISYWLYQNRVNLAKSFLVRCRKTYRQINPKIGHYDDIWAEVEKIDNLEGGLIKASERALTASLILLHHAQR